MRRWKIESRRCDVRDRAAVDALVSDIAQRHGGIDVLVNSAGMFLMAPIEDTSVAQAELVMDVNYVGTYNMIRAVLPYMKAAGAGIQAVRIPIAEGMGVAMG